jgi:hypothetical protein
MMFSVSSLPQTPISLQTATSSRLTPREKSLVAEETLLAEWYTERHERQEFEWYETDGTATAGVKRILTREFSRLATQIFVYPEAFSAWGICLRAQLRDTRRLRPTVWHPRAIITDESDRHCAQGW